MKISLQELMKMMRLNLEGSNLEFKRAKRQYSYNKMLQYCVAIANEGGGNLIMGVTDKMPRKVVGTSAFKNTTKTSSRIYDKLRFRVDIDEIIHSDGRVLVFDIPSRPSGTAYQFEGRYLMRSGEQLVSMSEDQLRKIFNEGKPDFLSKFALNNQSSQDIIQLLNTQSLFDLMKIPYPSTREKVLKKLVGEDLVLKKNNMYNITNLGALLFAKSLSNFPSLSRKAVRVVVYSGKTKTQTKLDKTVDKGYAVIFKELIDFIEEHTPSNEVLNAALRDKVKMYPKIAIRELVGNAIIHQDFNEIGTSVIIEIFSDRIEITNPGIPFIPTDRFIDEYQSRNEKMADILRRCRICEEKGSGIDKVYINIEMFQLPALDFRVKSHQTTVLLFSHKPISKMSGDERIRACYQHCSLKYVNNEKMSNKSLRDRFKLKPSQSETASRIIKDTQTKGLIKLIDPDNTSKRYAKYVPSWA